MPRTVNEVTKFGRKDLEELAKVAAKMEIVGQLYRGKIEDQTVTWLPDHSISVTTTHTPDN